MAAKLYSPASNDDGHLEGTGYTITEAEPGRWVWTWTEPNEPPQISPRYACAAAAYESAADDWSTNGDGGRLSATLRAQATRLKNAVQNT